MDAADASDADAGDDAADASDADAGDDAADASDGDGDASLAPCTVANPTNCVQCNGNPDAGNLCTPTEALFVQYDIDKGMAAAPGPDPDGGCYTCLELNGPCLDDQVGLPNGQGLECEDPVLLTGTAAECRAVISCVLGTSPSCASVPGQIEWGDNCYCGDASPCDVTPVAENGPCDSVIATGMGYGIHDGTDIENNFGNATMATGQALNIFICANDFCGQCLQ
jgi:hypothetical protein